MLGIVHLKPSHFIFFVAWWKNDWSYILAYKLPAKIHEYNFMTVKVTLPGKIWLYYYNSELSSVYTKPFLLWNVIDTDDFLTCKPFKLRTGQENLSEGLELGGIVIGNIGYGISSSGMI